MLYTPRFVRYLLAALAIAGASCAAPATSTPSPSPTPTARPTAPAAPATATPVPRVTATPQTNYRALAQTLDAPLGGLIISVRNNDAANARDFLQQFNSTADIVRGQLAGDLSPQSREIHGAIDAIRDRPRDVAVLERERERLLFIR